VTSSHVELSKGEAVELGMVVGDPFVVLSVELVNSVLMSGEILVEIEWFVDVIVMSEETRSVVVIDKKWFGSDFLGGFFSSGLGLRFAFSM